MKKYFFFALLAMLVVGCDSPNAYYPSGGGSDDNKTFVKTGDYDYLSNKSAVVYAETNLDESDYESVEYGFVYSTNKDDIEYSANIVWADNGERDEDVYTYSATISDLAADQQYYYCAMVRLNGAECKYGKVKSFTTLAAPGVNEISILTGSYEELTYNSVVLYSELEANFSNYTSIKYGISYSTNKSDLQSNNGTLVYCFESLQDNKYSVALSDLDAETKYYYCAFVYLNSKQYKFGTVKNFTTLEAPEIDGIGVFSVSDSKTVTFSKGNLQYTQSTNTWSFASAQYEVVGTDNVTGGSAESSEYGDYKYGDALADKVDLFGWSTNKTNFGVSASTDYYDYSGSFVDWGTNKIGNDAPNTWRTLTYEEWYYLRWERPNYSELCGVAQVNGVNGLIFLPDNWTCPVGVTFKSGFHSSYGVDYYAAYQTFTAEHWSKMEAAGAIFLPAAGYRYGSDVSNVQYNSYYWSATEPNGIEASYLYFFSDEAGMYGNLRYYGHSVRLVKDL